MKMRIKHPSQCPYGGLFDLNLPDQGMVGKGTSLERLEDSVRAWRKANGYPIGLDFPQELEQVVCERYPGECEGVDADLPLKRRLSLADVVRGTKVIAALKLSGASLVPREEALARYELCNRCPLNVYLPMPCGGHCGELKDVVADIIGGESMPFDSDSRSCAICGCYSAAHVRIPYDVLEKGLNDEMKRAFQKANQYWRCWKVPAK